MIIRLEGIQFLGLFGCPCLPLSVTENGTDGIIAHLKAEYERLQGAKAE